MKEQLDAKSRQALIDYRISRADETIKLHHRACISIHSTHVFHSPFEI
jgi:hypothetical protein